MRKARPPVQSQLLLVGAQNALMVTAANMPNSTLKRAIKKAKADAAPKMSRQLRAVLANKSGNKPSSNAISRK